MHAVVVKVKINNVDSAMSSLREQVVPQVSQAPGFVTGHWTRKDDSGLSMVIFDSEENASAAAERIRNIAPEDVEVEDVEVREVTAHA